LKEKLTKSGSNYELLPKNHDQHYRYLEKTIELLYSFKINVKVIQRFNYTLDDIQWSDAILTAGGDGTFLLAAAKLTIQKSLCLVLIQTQSILKGIYYCHMNSRKTFPLL
jgi:NAD+ kinase